MFEPSEFFGFLNRPQVIYFERKETQVLGTAIRIYLLALLFIGLINSLNLTILQAFFTLPIDESFAIPESMKSYLWVYFILVAIYAPFMEEIIFRLPLIFDPVYISLSISTLIALIVNKVFGGIFPMIIFLLLFFLITQGVVINKLKILSFWNINFKYIFYFLPLIFGVVHISN
jgi:hypothetical protein